VADGDVPQPDVALGAGEGQQPAQGLLGLGQQHRHGRPLGTVRPVRPALVGHGQAGPGVAGHEPPGPGPLERAVMVEQDGHAPPHQLGQGPVEQQPDTDGLAAVGADVELDHPVGPAHDRRAVRGPLHGQVGDGHGGLGHGLEGRLVLEPGQLPDEPVGRPRGQREGRLAAEGLWVAGVVGDVEQQVAAHVRADEVALRWAWTAVSWATPSAAYTSRQGVLTASEVIRSGLSPVLAQR
jgi:hypothetical protein